jgi:N-glycosylase/DNA lyase
MKNNFGMIKGSMEKIKDGRQLRNHFARNVVGYGMKEASHFMRNVGYRNLAILDRHILKNLCHFGVIETIPRTMTPGIYHEIEEKFVQFSKKLGIPMDELDLLFWSAETGEIFK